MDAIQLCVQLREPSLEEPMLQDILEKDIQWEDEQISPHTDGERIEQAIYGKPKEGTDVQHNYILSEE